MPRSKLDPNQIIQTTFDEQLEAQRVSVLPMEMSIELDAQDGDSVLVLKDMQVIQAMAGQLIDSSKASRMSVTISCNVNMIVGEVSVSLGSLAAGQVKEICSPQIQVDQNCTVILQS